LTNPATVAVKAAAALASTVHAVIERKVGAAARAVTTAVNSGATCTDAVAVFTSILVLSGAAPHTDVAVVEDGSAEAQTSAVLVLVVTITHTAVIVDKPGVWHAVAPHTRGAISLADTATVWETAGSITA